MDPNSNPNQTHVRMLDGTLRPCFAPIPDKPAPARKLLIVISYHDGDIATAEALGQLVFDLERMRNEEADIMFFRRFDSRIVSPQLVQNLQSKFSIVHQTKCRRSGALGYPFGPNEMWYDLVTMFAQREWVTRYYAWLNMEPDMVPTKANWIRELVLAYRASWDAGKPILGHIHDHRTIRHVNGGAVFPTDLWSRIGGGILTGGSPSTAYDLEKAPCLVPLATDSPLILLDFKRETIGVEELYASRKHGQMPLLYHGVKNMSAIAAVRSRLLSVGEGTKDLERGTVFTFFQPVQEVAFDEEQAMLQLWKDAWANKGWFPVVLGPVDARPHARWSEYEKRVSGFPTVRAPGKEMACWMRWLALDVRSGGLMVDYDVLPNNFTPKDLSAMKLEKGLLHVLSEHLPSAVYADHLALTRFIDLLMAYQIRPEDQDGGKPSVSDRSILGYGLEVQAGAHSGDAIFRGDQVKFLNLAKGVVICRNLGEEGYVEAKLVHFGRDSIHKFTSGRTRSSVEFDYLRGALVAVGTTPAPEQVPIESVPKVEDPPIPPPEQRKGPLSNLKPMEFS